MKTYTTKSNAVRAAKAAGIDPAHVTTVPNADGLMTGLWGVCPPKPEPEPETPAADAPKAKRAPGEAVQKLLAMLGRPEGATVGEIVAETGWLPHTTRARISATVGKAMGHTIATEKVAERGRVYKITEQAGGA